MTLVIVACGWQLILMVLFFILGCPVAQTGWISATVYPLRLCSTVRRSHEEGRVLTCRLCFWVLHTVSFSVPQLRAVPQYRPDLLHFTENTPRRLGSKQTERPSPLSTRWGNVTRTTFWNLNCFERLLKIWMFYHLPKCEVNLATFVAAAQSEKLQSSSTPKKET